MKLLDTQQLARALGWFSIGLGAAEVVAPGRLDRFLGVGDRTVLVRGFGVREIATGVGILVPGNPAPGVWARIAGDALDLAALGSALRADGAKRGRVGAALGAVVGITAVDVIAARRLGTERGTAGSSGEAMEVERSLTVAKPADELHRLWREPATVPRVMGGIAEVTVLDSERARWTVRGPLGRTQEWETRIVEERPGEVVRWEAQPGAAMPNSGWVRFRPGPPDWGTVVTLGIRFEAPGGALGGAAAKLAHRVPEMAVGKALRRFKNLAETGEIPTTEGQPAARADKD